MCSSVSTFSTKPTTVHCARDAASSNFGVHAERDMGEVADTWQGDEREMHIVTLCCRDIAAMATFYTRFGWRDTMPAVDNYFRFETGGALAHGSSPRGGCRGECAAP